MHFVWKMSSILSRPQCANIPQKNRSQVFPLTGFYPEALKDSRVLSSPGWVSRRAAGRAAGHREPISALTSLGFSGSFSNAARTFKCCYDQYKLYIHITHNLNTFRLYSFNHYPCDKSESIRSRNLVIPPTHATFRSRVWSYSEKAWAYVQNGITQRGRLEDGDMTSSEGELSCLHTPIPELCNAILNTCQMPSRFYIIPSNVNKSQIHIYQNR